MGRVRTVAEGIEKKHIEAAEQLHGFVRDVAVIGEIRGRTKPETVYGPLAVEKPDGRERQAADVDGRCIENVGDQTRPGRFRFVVVKNIVEAAPDVVEGISGSVNGNYAAL